VLWAVGGVGVVLALGAAALALLGMPTYDVPRVELDAAATPARLDRGKRLVAMLCRRCHFDGHTDALTGRSLPEGRLGKLTAPNLTRDPQAGIGGWSAGEVAVLLRTGIHPKTGVLVPPPVMPRWPRMSDEDLASIVAFLQSDDPWVAPRSEEPAPSQYSLVARFRALTSWTPYAYPRAPVPTPDRTDLELHGAYLVDHVVQCAACHGARWGDFDALDPPRTPGYMAGGAATADANGVVVRAANLTPHATGLEGWTSEQLRRVLLDGFGPDGKVVRWPMVRHAGLTPGEVEAIHAYLQTLEPVDHAIEPSPPYRMIGRKADGGRHLWLHHGCHYCHGSSGAAVADMRGAAARFPTDPELVAYLKDPAAHDPFTLMPAWAGVIADDEWAELCAHVRELSAKAPRTPQASDPPGPPKPAP
jgi:mono/diheme cytochrome c family protein